MMKGPVVSNTTPLNYLVLIGVIDVLEKMYGVVNIAEEVAVELRRARAPQIVRKWIADPPVWLRIHKVGAEADGSLAVLDAGERETIVLAEHLEARVIVIDDWAGRKAAERRGMACVGTLGLLAEAARLGLVEFSDTIDNLKTTSFRWSADVVDELLREDAMRRAGKL